MMKEKHAEITLTQEERIVVEAFSEFVNPDLVPRRYFIARNKDNRIFMHSYMPERMDNYWWSHNQLEMNTNMFPFINWDDGPWSLALLRELDAK